jgi:hypothetical protein
MHRSQSVHWFYYGAELLSNNIHRLNAAGTHTDKQVCQSQVERINIAKHKVIDAAKPLLLTMGTTLQKRPNHSLCYAIIPHTRLR